MRLIIALLGAFVLSSCIELGGERGNGERVEEEITVGEFNSIEVGGAFIIKLTQEESDKVVLSADENLLEYIEIAVRGDRLEINANRRLSSDEGIIVEVPVDDLRRLNLSGASEISSTNAIETENLEIDLSGAGKLELMLDVADLSMDVSGATLVYLEGVAKTLDINMSGAGSIEASELEAEDCYAQISGIGKIIVNVTGVLDADVSGLGKVEYVGEPKSVKGDVSGIGNVSRK